MGSLILWISIVLCLAGAAAAWATGQYGYSLGILLEVVMVGGAYLVAAWRLKA
jgi:hypothetical protein